MCSLVTQYFGYNSLRDTWAWDVPSSPTLNPVEVASKLHQRRRSMPEVFAGDLTGRFAVARPLMVDVEGLRGPVEHPFRCISKYCSLTRARRTILSLTSLTSLPYLCH